MNQAPQPLDDQPTAPDPGAAHPGADGGRGKGGSPADRAMTRYAAGDDGAFGEVYDEVSPLLTRYLSRRTSDRALVEDLVQQTFLKMHQHRGRFIPGAEVRPWACSIAVRLLIDRARHQAIARETSGSDTPDDHHGPGLEARAAAPPADDPEEALIARRLAAALQQALDDLPPRQAAAVKASREAGLSIEQIARMLSTTTTAAKLLVFKGMRTLRAAARVAADDTRGSPRSE